MIHQFTLTEVVPNLSFDVTLEPNKPVYCFIGKNGVGKTKMLEGLAKSVLYCHSMFHTISSEYKFGMLFTRGKIYSTLGSHAIALPQFIKLVYGDIEKKDKKYPNEKTLINIELKRITSSRSREFVAIDKPFVFISARGRGHLRSPNLQEVRFLGDIDDRFISEFKRLLDALEHQEYDNLHIAQWFIERSLINPTFVIGSELRKNEVDTVLGLLKHLEPSWNNVVQHTNEGQTTVAMYYQEGKLLFNNIAIDHLSTGFASILRLFQEIIAAYGAWTNAEDLSQVEGIVFIDEIESHLHAEWQSRIIPLLKKSFPKTTFYIATHSPIILATTDRDEAYELVKNEETGVVNAKKLGNPRAWYLADMLETAFHVDIDSVRNGSAGDVGAQLRAFSGKVKEYQQTPSDDLKASIDALYKQLQEDLAESDPRRRSAAALKELVG